MYLNHDIPYSNRRFKEDKQNQFFTAHTHHDNVDWNEFNKRHN